MIRGQRIYYNDGELAFDMAINTKKDVGTHSGIFLESLSNKDENYNCSKILDVNGRVKVISDSLISHFNI